MIGGGQRLIDLYVCDEDGSYDHIFDGKLLEFIVGRLGEEDPWLTVERGVWLVVLYELVLELFVRNGIDSMAVVEENVLRF